MPYIGNSPSLAVGKIEYQDLTGVTGSPVKRGFTLDHTVGSPNDIEVFVNNVRQEPSVAYTVAGTTLTMQGDVETTDDFYIVYQGKAVGTSTTTGGGGTYKGDNGTVNAGKQGDIFRVHEQTLNTDTTITSTENALASGPLTISATLTVNGNLTVV
jgi:hypothetical protein